MSTSVRAALFIGMSLGLICLVARLVRYRGFGFPANGFLEMIEVIVAPLPVPILLEIINVAMNTKPLPPFEETEYRLALVIGSGILICAIVYAVYTRMKRAFAPRKT